MNKMLLSVVGLFIATGLSAQDPFADIRLGDPTPGLQAQPRNDQPWNAAQEWDRYDSPQKAVHRKAAWKAAQRRQRLEAMKWMGYSPSRPPASPLPFMGSSSSWVYGVYQYHVYPGVFYPRTGYPY